LKTTATAATIPLPSPKVITIDRTPGAFVSDTQHLTTEEIGAYQLICDYIVIRGQDFDPPSIPDDDVMLQNITRINTRARWLKIKERLCSGPMGVLTVAHGRISQVRVAMEIEAAKERITAAYIGGKASGAARRAKASMRERLLNDRSTTVEQALNGEGNGSRTINHLPEEPTVPTASDARTSAKERVEAFQVEIEHRTWAADNAPDVDIGSETERWRDHLRANGYKTRAGPVRDAAASWRNWIANEQKWGRNRGSHGNHHATGNRRSDERVRTGAESRGSSRDRSGGVRKSGLRSAADFGQKTYVPE